jgi:protein-disulfide isomerase-like protein with CxxC motif
MTKVILFKGADCVPCKHFEPEFDRILEDFDLSIEKKEDDIQAMRAFGLRSVPSVVLVTNGLTPVVLTGANLRERQLLQAILSHLGDANDSTPQD